MNRTDRINGQRLTTPLADGDLENLRCGDRILLNGVIFTGRDAAHKKMAEALQRGEELPFDLKGQVIYFVGPTLLRRAR
jgi:fumarate hydratase subunit beta